LPFSYTALKASGSNKGGSGCSTAAGDGERSGGPKATQDAAAKQAKADRDAAMEQAKAAQDAAIARANAIQEEAERHDQFLAQYLNVSLPKRRGTKRSPLRLRPKTEH